jgi:hypothetical protein
MSQKVLLLFVQSSSRDLSPRSCCFHAKGAVRRQPWHARDSSKPVVCAAAMTALPYLCKQERRVFA